MRDIDRFTAQFAPPRSPLAPGIEDVWPDMQHRIGSVLPRDYKDFINAFGSVLLNELVRPFNPFSRSSSRNLLWQMGVQLGGMRELKQAFPENYPYPIWFEPGGLLPWGAAENALNFYWLTRGHPDQWTVVVEDVDAEPGRGFQQYDGSTVQFLDAFLNRTLDPRFGLIGHEGEYSGPPKIGPEP